MTKILFLACSLFVFSVGFSQGWITSVPLKLREPINSNSNELSPLFYVDSTTLYFTRNKEKKQYKGYTDQDIYVSKQEEDGKWASALPVSELNNELNNTILGFNYDGSKVYLLDTYFNDKTYVDGVAVSELENGKWTKPKRLPIEGLNIQGEFCGFSVNKEDNVMIISYLGPLSIGEEDLYASFKIENDVWSAPVHLGTQINTVGYEISPFLTYDSDTLFFASNGLGGMGGADIFFSVRLDDTWQNWTAPKNLGSPINSPSFDAYYHSVGNRIFWSSDRDSLTGEDIYYVQKIKPPKLKVDVTNVKPITYYGGKDGEVDVAISGGVTPYTYLWSNGSTDKNLKNVPDGEYILSVTDAVDQQFQIKVIVKSPEINKGKDLAMIFDPPIVLYYEFDKWELTVDSKKSLDRLINILKINPEVKIEIRSYTDCKGDDLYNLNLSKSRAKATFDYLSTKIENTSNLSWKGFGEVGQVVKCNCEKVNCTEEANKKNRRTEFVVLEF